LGGERRGGGGRAGAIEKRGGGLNRRGAGEKRAGRPTEGTKNIKTWM